MNLKVSGDDFELDSGSVSSGRKDSGQDEDEDPLLATMASTDELDVHAPETDTFDAESEPIFQAWFYI